jgi:hypothetical protein
MQQLWLHRHGCHCWPKFSRLIPSFLERKRWVRWQMYMPAAVCRKVAALWGEISPAAMESHQKSCTRNSPVNPAASSHTVNSLFNKLSTWSYSWHLTAFEESAYFKQHWEGKPMTHRTSSRRRSPQVWFVIVAAVQKRATVNLIWKRCLIQ